MVLKLRKEKSDVEAKTKPKAQVKVKALAKAKSAVKQKTPPQAKAALKEKVAKPVRKIAAVQSEIKTDKSGVIKKTKAPSVKEAVAHTASKSDHVHTASKSEHVHTASKSEHAHTVAKPEHVHTALKPESAHPVHKHPAVQHVPVLKETRHESAHAEPEKVKIQVAVEKIHPVPALGQQSNQSAKPQSAAPAPVTQPVAAVDLKEIELQLPITVKDLAIKLQEKSSVVIKMLMDMRVMASLNQMLDEATTTKICEKFKCVIKKALGEEELALFAHQEQDALVDLKPRTPIVTFMGHVDHGKTSLLDAIRKSKVVDSEHGGITQHIGAYRVNLPKGEIAFLDTPGHEAFTAMRARGASITDIVVLVVAADDGIMPQTQEAIDHVRAAGVSLIVALNKIDKPGANGDRVKKQLAALNLTPEEWGGKTIVVGVSAKTGEGIDNLLEMILLEAQMLELKANPKRLAKGVVIEAKLCKGRGPVATLLVQNGSLHLNQNIIVGNIAGKIRAMFNDHGNAVTVAGPSTPVEILGLSGVPDAGEQFFVVNDEKTARDLAQKRQETLKLSQVKTAKRVSLEDLHAQIKEGKIKELSLIIKADVHGSLEAIRDVLGKIESSEVKIQILHEAVGQINSSDVILAVASNALIIGFSVTADDRAKEIAAEEGVDIKIYNIIYELGNEIKAALEGMLEPQLKKNFQGRVDVRKVFKLTKASNVAGSFVSKGKVTRNSPISIVRNGQVVFEGHLSTLKRFKDDVREVLEGFECGLTVSGFELQEGDVVEAYEIERIMRKL